MNVVFSIKIAASNQESLASVFVEQGRAKGALTGIKYGHGSFEFDSGNVLTKS
jgi:hypothetical protein